MTKETFKSTEYVTTEKVIELPAIVRHDRSIYLIISKESAVEVRAALEVGDYCYVHLLGKYSTSIAEAAVNGTPCSEQDFNMAILSVINSVKEMADRHIFRNQ